MFQREIIGGMNFQISGKWLSTNDKMGDQQIRIRVLQERDWAKPGNVNLWPSFEAVVLKILVEWDVMKMAVEGGWSTGDPLWERAKVVDDALCNFAQRMRSCSPIDPHEVNTFLVDIMDDRFNAELESDTALSVSKILVKVYDESRQGITTGLRFLLGEQLFNQIQTRDSAFDIDIGLLGAVQSNLSTSTGSTQGTQQLPTHTDMSQQQIGDSPMQDQQLESQQRTNKPQPDSDGWETVPKRRSPRLQNQYNVVPNAWGGGGSQQLFQQPPQLQHKAENGNNDDAMNDE